MSVWLVIVELSLKNKKYALRGIFIDDGGVDTKVIESRQYKMG